MEYVSNSTQCQVAMKTCYIETHYNLQNTTGMYRIKKSNEEYKLHRCTKLLNQMYFLGGSSINDKYI